MLVRFPGDYVYKYNGAGREEYKKMNFFISVFDAENWLKRTPSAFTMNLELLLIAIIYISIDHTFEKVALDKGFPLRICETFLSNKYK